MELRYADLTDLHSNMDRLKEFPDVELPSVDKNLHSNMDRLKEPVAPVLRVPVSVFTFQYG